MRLCVCVVFVVVVVLICAPQKVMTSYFKTLYPVVLSSNTSSYEELHHVKRHTKEKSKKNTCACSSNFIVTDL